MKQGIGRAGTDTNVEAPPAEKPAAEPAADIDNKDLSGMGLNALNFEMNKAIDAGNWELAQKIQKMVDRKQGLQESIKKIVRKNLRKHLK
jgi:hypothetical protein